MSGSVFDFDSAERCVTANDERRRVDPGDGTRRHGFVFVGAEDSGAMHHYFPAFRNAQLDGAERGVDIQDGFTVGSGYGGAAKIDLQFAEAAVKIGAFEGGGIDTAIDAAEGHVQTKNVAVEFAGEALRGIEQNPAARSKWAQLAAAGAKVMQFTAEGRYRANVVDGKVTMYGKAPDAAKPSARPDNPDL